MSRPTTFLLIILFSLLAACQPGQSQTVEPLPTLASLPTAPLLPIEGAERVARAFLEAWRTGDFETMYSLTTFASQEANLLENFTAVYQTAASEMTLNALTYTVKTMYREQANIAVFSYDITFDTVLLGIFTDPDHAMRLIIDARAGDWRVAWSPGDIFPEMGSGARLRREISVPGRANIYDRNGLILADQNGRAVVVSAIKKDIARWDVCLPMLADALNKDSAVLQNIYDESSPDWLMEFGITEPAVYERTHVQLEETCAARFSSRPARRYTNGELFANIVGNVGYPSEAEIPALRAAGFNQDSILGRSGIEASWDVTLRGRPGGRLLIVTQGGSVVREVTRGSSKPTESVWLTLDSDLQAAVYRIIDEAYKASAEGWATTSKGAAVVIMDVHTGEILAMVSYPTFDPNAFTPFPPMGRDAANQIIQAVEADPRRPQLNRAALGLYPLGSVMKIISATAVADTGVYALDQKYTCSGIWNRDITRYDWLAGGHGTITLAQSLTRSCNPYYYEVGYQLDQVDPSALPSYARRMGMGQITGLRDISESAGLIIDPEWKRQNLGLEWSFSDAVNMSIGQGEVQVTPLQVARMFAALGNGGTLLRPQLVQQVGIIGEASSYTLTVDPMSEFEVRPEVFQTVIEGICNVTSTPAGTAEYQYANSPLQTIGVCGKTGTAQDGSSEGAVSHAWFGAYAPREKPQIAIAVIVENSGEGSGVAAPIVRDILEYYFFGEG